MLEIDFERVRDLENLTHPTGAHWVVLALRFFIVIVKQRSFLAAFVNVHDRRRGASYSLSGFFTIVFTQFRNQELELLLFFLASGAALFFHCLDMGSECVIVARRSFSAPQLSEELELIRFDIFTDLTIVTVNANIDHLAGHVLVFLELNLTDTLCGLSEKSKTNIALDCETVVFWRNLRRWR